MGWALARTVLYVFVLAVIAGSIQVLSTGEWTWAEVSGAGACGILLFPITYLGSFLRARGASPGCFLFVLLGLGLALASFGISLQVFMWHYLDATAGRTTRLDLVTELIEAAWKDKGLWVVHVAVAIPFLDHLWRRIHRTWAAGLGLLLLLAVLLLFTGSFGKHQVYAYLPGRPRPVALWSPATGAREASSATWAAPGQSSMTSISIGGGSSGQAGVLTRRGGISTQSGYSLGWIALLQTVAAMVLLGLLGHWEDRFRLRRALPLGQGSDAPSGASPGRGRGGLLLKVVLLGAAVFAAERALSLGPEDVDGLLRDLEGQDAAEAALDLGRLGEFGERSDEVVGRLATLLRRGEPAERDAAAWSLSRLRGRAQGALPDLVWAYGYASSEDVDAHWTAILFVAEDRPELARLFALEIKALAHGPFRLPSEEARVRREAFVRYVHAQVALLTAGEVEACESLAALLGNGSALWALDRGFGDAQGSIHAGLRKLGPAARAASPHLLLAIRRILRREAGIRWSGWASALAFCCRTLAAVDPEALALLQSDPLSAELRTAARKATNGASDPASGHQGRAWGLAREDKPEQAVAEMRQAIALYPLDPSYRLALARLFEKQGRPLLGLLELDEVLGERLAYIPRGARLAYPEEGPHWDGGDTYGKEFALPKIDRDDPASWRARHERALLLVGFGVDLELALADFEQVARESGLGPQAALAQALLFRGRAHVHARRMEDAIRDLSKSCELKAERRSLFARAYAFYRSEQGARAQQDLDALFALPGMHSEDYARRLQPRVHYARGRFQEAIRAVQRVTGDKGTELGLLEARALILLRRYDAAKRALVPYMQGSGAYPQLWLGALDRGEGRLEYHRIGGNAKSWIARFLLGEIDAEALLAVPVQAREFHSTRVDFHCLIALRAEVEGRESEARAHYAQAAAVTEARDRLSWRFALLRTREQDSPKPR